MPLRRRRRRGRRKTDRPGASPEQAAAAEAPKRRRWPWILGLFVAFLFGRCTAETPLPVEVPQVAAPAPEKPVRDSRGAHFGPCSATGVRDGAHLDVYCGGFGNAELELLYVAAPPPGHPDYWDAGRVLAGLVTGRELGVELHGDPERDEDGRIVRVFGYAFDEDRNLAVEMVRKGWVQYVDPDGTSFYGEQFRGAAAAAPAPAARVRP